MTFIMVEISQNELIIIMVHCLLFIN